MTHRGTQTLLTQRATLRRFTMEDADAMFANWAGDPEVTRYLLWDAHPDRDATREVLRTWVDKYARDAYYNWAIVLGSAPVGNISVVNHDDRDEWAEIGYVIGRSHWGRGIMTEVLRRVLEYLFREVKMHRVTLRHDVENIGSGRVMLKNGLVREGVLRKAHRRKDGSWADMAVYGALREEWG